MKQLRIPARSGLSHGRSALKIIGTMTLASGDATTKAHMPTYKHEQLQGCVAVSTVPELLLVEVFVDGSLVLKVAIGCAGDMISGAEKACRILKVILARDARWNEACFARTRRSGALLTSSVRCCLLRRLARILTMRLKSFDLALVRNRLTSSLQPGSVAVRECPSLSSAAPGFRQGSVVADSQPRLGTLKATTSVDRSFRALVQKLLRLPCFHICPCVERRCRVPLNRSQEFVHEMMTRPTYSKQKVSKLGNGSQ